VTRGQIYPRQEGGGEVSDEGGDYWGTIDLPCRLHVEAPFCLNDRHIMVTGGGGGGGGGTERWIGVGASPAGV